jgi:hypothetical protein
LAYVASDYGALIVEVNREPTLLTAKADYSLLGNSGNLMPALLAVLS